MSFDDSFDQTRLDQLAGQHLKSSNITGRVLFFGDDENRLELTTWQFDNDENYKEIKSSDFKVQLLELLDTLLIYRAHHDQPNASQGVVHVRDQQLSIEWLPLESVESLRNG